MIKLLYKIYFTRINNNTIDSLFLRIIVKFTNFVLPLHYILTKRSKKNRLNVTNMGKNEEPYIVSLTTFPARIDNVWLTIETILHQTEKPDKILLWLYKGEFNGKLSLPKRLIELEKRGLKIKFCNENLLPHKKYYYTMLAYPDANIITIDDDMLYPPNLLTNLIKIHKKYPSVICCSIARGIRIKDAQIKPYVEWEYVRINTIPGHKYLPIGVGGTLYPAKSLHEDVFDKESLSKLALRADDLWLKVMGLKNKTKVISIAGEYPRFFIPIIQKNNVSLMDSNIGEGQNDIILKDLIEYYSLPISIFINK